MKLLFAFLFIWSTQLSVFSSEDNFFETKIAPILANHCLECHDATTQKGGLDLSRRTKAFLGGDEGPAIIEGKSSESLLWETVINDDMPKKRDPLSAQEKDLLKRWIDGGAHWSVEFLDPAVFGSKTTDQRQWVRRLTQTEYIESIRVALGVEIQQEAQEILPPDLRTDGFSNTAYNLNVDLKHVNAYATLAEAAVSKMDIPKFAKRFYKDRTVTKKMRELISKMGHWILRGPLNKQEISDFRGIATTVVASGGDFDQAVGYVIEAMIQSPRFLYKIERQTGKHAVLELSQMELATRLSFMVLGTPPDQALLNLAKKKALTDEVIQQQVARLLKHPRAVDRSLEFIEEWLHLDRLKHINPDVKRFPNWKASLADDMRQETLAFAKEAIWKQNKKMTTLFDAQYTYLTPQLAKHYGIAAKGNGLQRYDLKDIPERRGLLTHGSLLTIGGEDASMVTRGLFILHDVLRGVVKDPPPGLNTEPVPAEEGISRRRISQQRIADNTCGGCHEKFEPLAFAFEQYDGLGTFIKRDEYNNTLRQDGRLMVPGADRPVSFETTSELASLLANSPRVHETLTWKLIQFVLGRPLGVSDRLHIETVSMQANQKGGTYQAVLMALATSDLMKTLKTEQAL